MLSFAESINTSFPVLSTIIVGIISIYWTFIKYKDYVKKHEFESAVEYFKIHRKFIKIFDNDSDDIIVRVMSYNILAPDPSGWDQYGDKYAMSKKHDYCPRKYRFWSYRMPRIMAQIVAYCPDIICMQETTTYSFDNYLKYEFNKLNYNGWNERRSLKYNICTEAIFWNKNKYKCLNKKLFRFNESKIYEKYMGKIHENNKFYNKFKSRDDILMVLHLNDIKNNKDFIICSSHLFWDPNWSDIKLLQCMLLHLSLYHLIVIQWKLDINNIGIIFGIDANSLNIKTKSDQYDKITNDDGLINGVYELMTKGFVDKTHSDHPSKRVYLRNYQDKYWEINNDDKQLLNEQINFVKNIDDFSNNEYGKLLWKSAYNINNKDAIYTTKVDDFEGTIDYIFYNKNIQRISYLEMPFENDIHKKELNASNQIQCAQNFEYLPNKYYPSDHIALVSDFKLL